MFVAESNGSVDGKRLEAIMKGRPLAEKFWIGERGWDLEYRSEFLFQGVGGSSSINKGKKSELRSTEKERLVGL